jgi:hypothetical protein
MAREMLRCLPGLRVLALHLVLVVFLHMLLFRCRMAREMLRCLPGLRVLELRAFSGAEEGCSHVIDIVAQLPALQVLVCIACALANLVYQGRRHGLECTSAGERACCRAA